LAVPKGNQLKSSSDTAPTLSVQDGNVTFLAVHLVGQAANGVAGGTTNTAIWPKSEPSLSFCCLVVRISEAGLILLVIRKSFFSVADY
jgi:hypothetical protein